MDMSDLTNLFDHGYDWFIENVEFGGDLDVCIVSGQSLSPQTVVLDGVGEVTVMHGGPNPRGRRYRVHFPSPHFFQIGTGYHGEGPPPEPAQHQSGRFVTEYVQSPLLNKVRSEASAGAASSLKHFQLTADKTVEVILREDPLVRAL